MLQVIWWTRCLTSPVRQWSEDMVMRKSLHSCIIWGRVVRASLTLFSYPMSWRPTMARPYLVLGNVQSSFHTLYTQEWFISRHFGPNYWWLYLALVYYWQGIQVDIKLKQFVYRSQDKYVGVHLWCSIGGTGIITSKLGLQNFFTNWK